MLHSFRSTVELDESGEIERGRAWSGRPGVDRTTRAARVSNLLTIELEEELEEVAILQYCSSEIPRYSIP
jgi:hypothetical protein